MGAFDGLRIYGYSGGQCVVDTYPYFKHQSSFSFFKGFGLLELKQLLSDAEKNDDDTIWVRKERPGDGHLGLSTWYVKALIENFENENSSSQ